ncbi:aspartate--tRNA ligase dps1 [Lobulomyces angularis]|nr:aspartate--tRNA ligase dps1 [Lobulomyces angularis]
MTEQKEETILGEDGKPLTKSALKKLQKEKEKAAKKKEVADRLAAEKAAREAQNEADCSKDRYGVLPLNQSQERTFVPRAQISELNSSMENQVILMRARIQTSRLTGTKRVFLTLRQRTHTVQAILSVEEGIISKQMLKFVAGISSESLVLLEAKVLKPEELVKSCTLQNVELHITKLHVISASERLPFTMEDASRSEVELENDATLASVKLDTRLNNRVVDLRTSTNQAIFTLQGAICKLFREYLDGKSFTEIHSPKLLGAASEGGANVFKVTYFKTNAFLAQSPQLFKQMTICSDFERVYEIAPVFRAEDSNTHRHLTEFMGLDMEMAIEEHYHEVLDLFDELFVYLFKELKKRYSHELSVVSQQFPFEEFEFLPKSLRLNWKEGIQMLRDAGVEIGDFEDMNTEKERTLGRLVKEKYKTDFYMLDKFPTAIRPFYTMPDAKNPEYSNSFDFFIRGEEVLSGAQRVHDAELLLKRSKEHQIEPHTIQGYLDAFKYGAPPHAGGGIGLERVLMLYLNLGNIRRTSLFPRDPKRLEP